MAGIGGLLVLALCIATALTAGMDTRAEPATTYMDIRMKGAHPSRHDAYLCTSYPVEEEEAYIVKFEALASADTAHHILMYGCDGEGFSSANIWDCPPICRGAQQIIFAWAKNAPPTKLPDGVGFKIGKKTHIRTIVMQIHYAKSFTADEAPDTSGIRLHITREQQPYVAGIFLMMSFSFAVPPNVPKYHVDMSCYFNKAFSMFPFAYRTHAHGLGRVITGYQFNNTGYHMIGKGNPQWPQAFYPSNASIEVKPGDKLVARCTYNSTGMNHAVHVGATGNDEMCNFYIMFYTNSTVMNPGGECGGVQIRELVDNMPADSDVTLPPNPLLDEVAHGHHHHHAMAHSSTPGAEHVAPTGDLPAQDPDPVFSSDERWLDLPGVDISPRRQLFLQYLAQTAGNRSPSGQDARPALQNASSLEEKLPDYFETWLRSLGDISLQKRMGGEYYDDYAANDEREQGTFSDSNPGLSRNRNKAFEAMNQELKGFEHIKPHGETGDAGHWQQYPKTSSRKKVGSLPVPNSAPAGSRSHTTPQAFKLHFEPGWPSEQTKIGQVGGVATDNDGNVYVFHRGQRVWDATSFDYDNNFQYREQPIMEDTVLIFSKEGKLVRKFGRGKFFMPHGIEVDTKGNIWLTDVALHQVFRIPAGGTEPDMTLGERFVHNEDAAHFCKPTDVAILASGDFFISDGYCNSRVLKFSKEGNLLKQWGRPNLYATPGAPAPGVFDIPHSVTVAEEFNLVCVADRENGRIQCFDLEGNFKYIIKHPEFGARLFAVEYCPLHGGLLFAVNGPTFDGQSQAAVGGFTISLSDSEHSLLDSWNLPTPQGLQNPHDVAVDSKRHAVYVAELSPPAVWKFRREITAATTTTTTKGTTATVKPATVQQPVTQVADKKNSVEPSAAGEERDSAVKDSDRKEAVEKHLAMEEEELEEDTSDFTPSIIIGVLLVIPVVLLLVITLVMRMHHRGAGSCFSSVRTPKVFNLQSFLGNSHKGFDKLSQDDSDHDADVLSDSDNEEFRQPVKSKA